MRKRLWASILGAAVVVGLSVAPGARAAVPVPVARPATPAVQVCGEGASLVRPASMILTCADSGELARSLHWTSWTAISATATGTVAWRACTADCALSKRWATTTATVILSRPVREAGQRVLFTRLDLHVTGRTPPGFLRHQAFDEAPVAPSTSLPKVSIRAGSSTRAVPDQASGTLRYNLIEGFWLAAGGPSGSQGGYTDEEIAAAITGAESSFYPGIVQPDVSYCGPGADRAGWGLWQITCGNAVSQFGTNFQLLDPWNNAEAAVSLCEADIKAGVGCFAPWVTYETGAYTNFLQQTAPELPAADPGEYVQVNSTPSGTPSSPAASPGSTYGTAMVSGTAHVCTSLGTYDGVEGDLCADLVSVPNSGSTYLAALQIEAFCQNSSGYVQCSGANLYGNTYDPSSAPNPIFTACGHSYGDCGTPRNYSPTLGGFNVRAGSCDNHIWGVIFAKDPVSGDKSYIILPGSDHFLYLTSNFETGHNDVCN
jgi:Transglycosylase SLT domain